MSFHYLEHLFSPRSVAVIGASERTGSLGRIAFDNLRSGGYAGELIAVNPKYQSIAGVPCHASIAAIGHRVDLVLVTSPAATVPAVIGAAGEAGTRSALVLSAGFGEIGAEGRLLEQKVLAAARDAGYRRMIGYVLPDADSMLKLAARLNFKRGRDEEDPTLVKVARSLA